MRIHAVHPRFETLLSPGERILAIDGKPILGLSRSALRSLNEGDAGDTVTLIVQGKDLDDATYREVTVQRVAPKKASTPL